MAILRDSYCAKCPENHKSIQDSPKECQGCSMFAECVNKQLSANTLAITLYGNLFSCYSAPRFPKKERKYECSFKLCTLQLLLVDFPLPHTLSLPCAHVSLSLTPPNTDFSIFSSSPKSLHPHLVQLWLDRLNIFQATERQKSN